MTENCLVLFCSLRGGVFLDTTQLYMSNGQKCGSRDHSDEIMNCQDGGMNILSP